MQKKTKKIDSKKHPETSWGGVADWYDAYLEGTQQSYQETVIAPNLLRLVAPKKGMQLLDLACGQGYFSRLFQKEGALVVGADIAPELVAYAKAHSTGITYHATPAHKLGFAQGETFDVITVVLAIQNITNMQEVLHEMWRVLKPGGKAFLVLNHPTFRVPQRFVVGL
jgi:ubiquinone/menaquinone biosynthesis C-methylase UbiE